MHSAAIELFQLLVQAGAVPGEDFSCDPNRQGYRLNQRSLELLSKAYPEIDWQDLCAVCEPATKTLIETLHRSLRVPFVDNLLPRLQAQIQQLPAPQATWYLNQILVGVEQRTGIDLLMPITDRLSVSTQARVEWLLRQDHHQPCDDWLADLVQAAGGTADDIGWDDHGIYFSERGLTLLEQVWLGDCEAIPVLPRLRDTADEHLL
jgi:hypothetical protein